MNIKYKLFIKVIFLSILFIINFYKFAYSEIINQINVNGNERLADAIAHACVTSSCSGCDSPAGARRTLPDAIGRYLRARSEGCASRRRARARLS